MALKIEGIVDGGMHAQEALGGSSRLEPLHCATYVRVDGAPRCHPHADTIGRITA
jgi:hypothetical protein